MIKEKYLPLGTVVLLKNATKRLVVIGYGGVSTETGKKMFDYIACLYPEGLLSSNKNLLFDHSQIEKVIFEGFADEEDKTFKEKLKVMVENYNSKVNMNSELEIPMMDLKSNKDEIESDSESGIETFEI